MKTDYEEGASNPNLTAYLYDLDKLDRMIASLEEIKQQLLRDKETTLAELFQGKKT